MAFSEGVRPGGLYEQQDIQVLICYLLDSVGEPVEEQLLKDSILANEIANLFEVAGALSVLLDRGTVVEEDGWLTLTENGREAARLLGAGLPLTLRERSLQTAVRLMAQKKAAAQTKVDICPLEHGVRVDCAVDTAEEPMMKFSLVVADKWQAELVRDRFLENPSLVYRTMIELLMDPKLKKTDDMLYIPLR